MTRIRGLQLDELAPFDWVDVFGGLRGSETVFLEPVGSRKRTARLQQFGRCRNNFGRSW